MKLRYIYYIMVCLGLQFFKNQPAFAQNTDSEKESLLSKIDTNKRDSIKRLIKLPYGKLADYKFYPGAISYITGDNMSLFRTSNNSNMLAGRLAGLTTNMFSSEPGFDGSSLNVWGTSSFNSTTPNIFVDNIPIGFDQLDPLEIDQLVVLKDASANAVYGINGANKNIIVSTKRGVAYENKINFYSQFGYVVPMKKPNFLGAKQYMTLYNEALVNDGKAVRYTQDNINQYDNTNRDMELYPDVNWGDELIKNKALQQKYNITFSGGSENVRYFVLLGYMKQNGLLKYGDISEESLGYNTNTNFDRYNFRSNIDFKVNKSLNVSLDLSGRLENKNSPGTSTGNIFNSISTYAPNLFPMIYSDGKLGGFNEGGLSFTRNPYGLITRTGNVKQINRNLAATLSATQSFDKFVKGLSFTGTFSTYNFNFNSEGSTNGAINSDFAVYTKKADGTFTKINNDGIYAPRTRGQLQDRTNLFYGKFDYSTKFGDEGTFDATLGYNQSSRSTFENSFPYVTQGFFANANYVLKSKFVAQLNIGYNGSENLAPGKRFGFFPTVSAAWLMHKEDFLRTTQMSTFKLRASYGLTGNSNFGFLGGRFAGLFRYLYADGYTDGNSYVFGRNPTANFGRVEGSLANADLTWETAKTANIGLDLGMFNDKVSATVNAFTERRDNILAFPNTISAIIGATFKPLNVGIVNNKGLDWDLGYNNNTGDFSYGIHFLGSLTKSKIIFQDEEIIPYDYLRRTGLEVGTTFGLDAIGFFADQNDITNSPKQTFSNVKPGDIKYRDINGDKIIDAFDQIAIGKPFSSNFYYGGQLQLRYKNVDLIVWLQGTGNRSINVLNAATLGFAAGAKPTDYVLNRWTPQTATTANYPRLSVDATVNDNNYLQSTFWVKNGKYLRIKNVELGYNFSPNTLKHIKLAKARFYVSALNLYTWKSLDIDYMDPESLTAGITTYPATQAFQMGLNVEF